MAFYGSWAIDGLLTFAANTHSTTTGAATDADAVPAYRVYEDETGTAILTGNMAKLDDANTTGFYSEQITLSAANGFEKGKSYTIYISAAVNSVTSTMHHNFQIGAAADLTHIAGSAVSTSSAQLGVNVVNAAGTAWGSGAITAASIATDAITATKIAANAITSSEIADGAITAAKFAAGAIDATAIATGAIDADALAADAITAAKVASDVGTEIGTAVWATATRSLTVLDEDSTTLDLDVTIRAALGLASANLDTQLAAIDDFLDTEIAAIKAKTDNLPASPAATSDIPTANANADALLDRAAGVETGMTPRQAMRIILAALAGKLSGAATTSIAIRDTNDTKDRIAATVDSDGNRTSVTLDAT